MKYTMPNLTTENAINMCLDLDKMQYGKGDDFIYCFKAMSTFEPFAMLIAINKMRRIKESFPDCNHKIVNFEHCRYGANVAFFNGLGADYGKKVNHTLGSNNHIPVSKITKEDFYNEMSNKLFPYQEGINRYAWRAAKVISRNKEELEESLQFLIREMIRNTFEHSHSDEVWLTAQGWPSRNRVEIAIVDNGIGIKKSLLSNWRYENLIRDDHDALTHAILPGITRTFSGRNKREDEFEENPWANSGFGLYTASKICDYLDGEFIIMSGNKALKIFNGEHEWIDTSFEGTAIKLSLPISWHSGMYFEYLLDDIVNEGEAKALELSEIAQSTASAASKSIALSKLIDRSNK